MPVLLDVHPLDDPPSMTDQPGPDAVLRLDRKAVLRLKFGLQSPNLALQQLLHDSHRTPARRAVARRVPHDRLPRQSLLRDHVGELLDGGLAVSLHHDGGVPQGRQELQHCDDGVVELR
eukprot:5459371-Heterocapsa_arctica.AAC.1